MGLVSVIISNSAFAALDSFTIDIFFCYPSEFARQDVVNFPFTRLWFFLFPLCICVSRYMIRLFFIQLVQDWIFWSFCVCNMGLFCHRDTRVWIFHILHFTFARLDFFAFCDCKLGRQYFSLCVLRLDFKSVWDVFRCLRSVHSAFCFSRSGFLRHMVGIFFPCWVLLNHSTLNVSFSFPYIGVGPTGYFLLFCLWNGK
jgi:hypothetical protein